MSKSTNTPERFDPFSNRIARDIRNRLSAAFAEAIHHGQPLYRETVRQLCSDHHEPVYRHYLEDRLQRYDRVWERLSSRDAPEEGAVFRLLWNQRLFFECHEILEIQWKSAEGEVRKALQGLILAAGVYIHLELGRNAPAETLARRALDRIDSYRHYLLDFADPDTLIETLRSLNPRPPRLADKIRLIPAGSPKKSNSSS